MSKSGRKCQKRSLNGIETPKIPDLVKIALKVDPETLDTTDEVRIESLQKVPESSQNGKTPP